MTHEVGRAIKKDAPRKFEELKEFIKTNFYTDGSWDAAVNTRYEQYKRLLGEFTWEKAEEEVVCNSLGRILGNSRVMNKLYSGHRSLFGRIWQLVKGFFDRIAERIKKIGKYSNKTVEQRIVEEGALLKRRKLENMFVKALRSANESARAHSDVKGAEKESHEQTAAEDNKTPETAENEALTSINQGNMHVSEGEKKYSLSNEIKYPSYDNAKINENIEKLAEMEPVAKIEATKLNKTGKAPRELFEEYFASLGNAIYSKEFGYISLGKSSVKSEIRHGLTAEKIASMEAIPDVIENGKVIFISTKNSDVERIVIAAPIYIGVQNYYMGVMLQRDTQTQYLYLHNVTLEKEMHSSAETHLLTTGVNAENKHLFITSILQNAINVKLDKQKNKGNLGKLNNISYSLADSSDREILAEAFYNLAENDEERAKVRAYRKEIALIDEKLADRNRLIRRLEEMGGTRGSVTERTKINNQIQVLDDIITRHDQKLLELSAAKPFRNIVERYERDAKKSKRSDEHTVVMTRGKFNKFKADYTHDKVYSKKDAKIC